MDLYVAIVALVGVCIGALLGVAGQIIVAVLAHKSQKQSVAAENLRHGADANRAHYELWAERRYSAHLRIAHELEFALGKLSEYPTSWNNGQAGKWESSLQPVIAEIRLVSSDATGLAAAEALRAARFAIAEAHMLTTSNDTSNEASLRRAEEQAMHARDAYLQLARAETLSGA